MSDESPTSKTVLPYSSPVMYDVRPQPIVGAAMAVLGIFLALTGAGVVVVAAIAEFFHVIVEHYPPSNPSLLLLSFGGGITFIYLGVRLCRACRATIAGKIGK